MGCCNKEFDGTPIGRLRYNLGLATLFLVHSGIYILIYGFSLDRPGWKKIKPFFREFTKDTLGGVGAKERIRIS